MTDHLPALAPLKGLAPETRPIVARLIQEIVHTVQEPLGLAHISIRLAVGEIVEDQCTAGCSADPEYKQMLIGVDFDKLATGEDLAEIVVHEMSHYSTWPLHALAERLANTVADMLPEYAQEAMRTTLLEEVRIAAETVATDVGHTNLRLLRRADILPTPNAEPYDAASLLH